MAVHNEGQYEEAEKLMRSGIAVLEKHLGTKKVEVLAARNDLGSTLLRLKRYDEAKNEYQYVLDQLKEVVGMENPFTMRTLQNLARYYNLRGDYTRALPMFEQAFDLRRRVLGLEHPSTLRTWHNLAYVHCLLGQMEEAENMFAGVVAAKEKVLGPLHWDTLNAMTGLANIYRTTGQTVKAHDLYKKTLEGLEKETDSRRQKMIDDIQQTLEADRVGTGGAVAHVIV
jgi:tetratricopeptide (TPR) repeat protein